ncbi:Hsp20/alpha crystallin family protein [Tepidiforma sp.]|uniref:Hsp20/alpha crystallin family protein n=1 Tax=Tepidiforma sp. TaxID=2682230 RepID=UPI002ADE1872|nr:Hsp20/alpha crystallin family protein [Tepidiforma sp.]
MVSIVRWNPFEELWAVPPREWLGRLGLGTEAVWQPRVDVAEREDAFVVHAELPGVEAKDIEVTVADGVLTLRGEKRSEREEEQEGRVYRERFFGSFERRLPVPETVDIEGVEASLKDGVLEVRLPKRAPEPKEAPKKVTIRTS